MHQNVVEVPEIDVRQILSQDALHLGIQRLAHIGIDLPPSFVDESVHLGI
jgi:hypothetical protein